MRLEGRWFHTQKCEFVEVLGKIKEPNYGKGI
jgi:hypothetical protein